MEENKEYESFVAEPAADSKEMTAEKKAKRRKKAWAIVSNVFFSIYTLIVFVLILLYESVIWGLNKWQNLTIEEMIYTLKSPLTGTGQGFVGEYIKKALVPAVIITLALIIAVIIIRHFKKKYITMPFMCAVLAVAVFMGGFKGVYYFWNKLDVGDYVYNQMHPSKFIENHYVNPKTTKLTFPKKKRNVIYLYLESMEQTYMNAANGGHHAQNLIPELTELARQNISFSDTDSYINGAKALTGNTWTIGAMFGATSGLPLKTQAKNNENSNATVFYPGIRTFGDILSDAGYTNTLMIGSDASFGGRDRYFSSHGDYDIEDYVYAKAKKWIPSNYKVFWGYEDEKLFGFAKKKLTSLSKGSKPFNMTMLTVDTHFYSGYKCHLCRNDFKTQYENVIACSSRQVTSFIKWCQQQSWYKDTTIIVSGDHPTMNGQIQKGTPWTQRLVYTCYINSAVKRQNKWRRNYSTEDNFPTSLAAMGVKIDGDRLGLGTNLFSNKKTLLEQYGFNYVNKELKKKSNWMEKQMAVSRSNRVDVQQAQGKLPIIKLKVDPYTVGNQYAKFTITSMKVPKKFKMESLEVNVSYRDDGAYGNTVIVSNPKVGSTGQVDISDSNIQWHLTKQNLKVIYGSVYVKGSDGIKYKVGSATAKVTNNSSSSS